MTDSHASSPRRIPAVDGLQLTPPESVPNISPEQAEHMVPIDEQRSTETARRAKQFVESLRDIPLNSPEYAQKLSDIENMGRAEIEAAAHMSNRMLERPMLAVEGDNSHDPSNPSHKVASDLVDLKRIVRDLDPKNLNESQVMASLRKILPFKDKYEKYLSKYSSAKDQIDYIIESLKDGKNELGADNDAIEREKTQLWETMGRLQEYAVLTTQLREEVDQEIEAVRSKDVERADTLNREIALSVHRKHQDLLTQLSVSAQGYLALDMVKKNNVELMKGVDRASTTTISALRTAVTVAQALANQRRVLDQINSLNDTTSTMIDSTAQVLQQQSSAIHQQASSSAVSIDSLEAAFTTLYGTIDAVDGYKDEAVESIRETISRLQHRLSDATAYLEESQRTNIQHNPQIPPGRTAR